MMYKKKEVPTQSIGTRIKAFGAHYSIVAVFHYSNCERKRFNDRSKEFLFGQQPGREPDNFITSGMHMKKVRTRFPPSPTGHLHIGGARTAIFNWLLARHEKGEFVLRFEDTDRVRSRQDFVDSILQSLEWLGIDWDDGPYFQSERYSIYEEYLQKLLDTGHAYYCTCSQETLNAKRKAAMERGEKPKYDGTCRDKGLPKTEGAVVRFRSPLTGITVVNDVIKGMVSFDNRELDDLIIQRSDGSPTYNFAVVVDDITMKINTIIRGDDHLNNTPRQILLYKALGYPVPVFGHVPMVLGSDRKRLSKRHGATSIAAYKEAGYLPQALVNYLVRLGWSHGDQEFFTIEELVEKFSLENIGHSAGIFNPEKLLALNKEHIMASDPQMLAPYLKPFLAQYRIKVTDDAYLCRAISTLQTRSKTLLDMAKGSLFYFVDHITYEEKAARKFLKPDILATLELLLQKLETLPDFTEESLKKVFTDMMEETGLKLGSIAQPVRVALTGGTVSPGIFEIMEVLGKKRVTSRLKAAIDYIR